MKFSKSVLVVSAIVALGCTTILLIASIRVAHAPAIGHDAVALASSVSTNLTTARTQLTDISHQTTSVDFSDAKKSLLGAFEQCLSLSDRIQGGSVSGNQLRDWGGQIRSAARQGQESVWSLQSEVNRVNSKQQYIARTVDASSEELAKQQETINKLIVLIEKQQSSKTESGPITVIAAIVGLIGSISTIMLAWRSDSRELLKLEIELAKLRLGARKSE
jgi:hypothetical protein